MALKNLREDIENILAHDPAARSRAEVVFCYPGFHVLLFYRVAHWLWVHDLLLLGRFVSHIGRLLTGIEIHPGAKIGRRLFIDHGMGVVIGETAELGDDVTLYQGVTLGGTSLNRGKRHPTLENGVIVGSGAQVLGGFTVGRGARLGANAVVLSEVPPGATMVGIPARVLSGPRPVEGVQTSRFLPYGTPCDEVLDPVLRTINLLRHEVESLRARLEHVEEERVLGRGGDEAGDATEGSEPTLLTRRQG